MLAGLCLIKAEQVKGKFHATTQQWDIQREGREKHPLYWSVYGADTKVTVGGAGTTTRAAAIATNTNTNSNEDKVEIKYTLWQTKLWIHISSFWSWCLSYNAHTGFGSFYVKNAAMIKSLAEIIPAIPPMENEPHTDASIDKIKGRDKNTEVYP